jgi:hypothetical protein
MYFPGYSLLHKGYKCLDIDSGRVYISRGIIFDETNFPFTKYSPTALHPTPSTSSIPALRTLQLDYSSTNLGRDHMHGPLSLDLLHVDARVVTTNAAAPGSAPL